jgi:CPA1 family monovalent cation:H+ antiporter
MRQPEILTANLQAGEGNTASNVTTVLWLLIAVAVVAVLSRYIRIPYVIALVLAGLAIALVPGIPTVSVTPDLIVIVFLPALLFEAAYNLSYQHLRQVFRFISALAILGVFATAGLVAGMLIGLAGLPWQTALLFGAIVAATDPVSVVAAFRKLGAPRRLSIIIEGESLFNDGSALVLFNLLVGVVVAGRFDLAESITEFLKVAVGGLLLGVAAGYLALGLLSRLNEPLLETLVTLIVAYGTFLAADFLHLSPALAVVAAGLLVGNLAQERVMSPTTRVTVGLSWELIGFLANSLIFLLVGLEIRAINFTGFWEITLLAIFVTLLSRCIVVAFFSWLTWLINHKARVPFSWQIIMIWGGLRGALSLALALSLPVTLASGQPFPDRDMLLVMTFGIILFTLLVQGLTIEPLLQWLKLGRDSSAQLQQYESLRSRMLTARIVRQRMDNLLQRSLLSEDEMQQLRQEYQEREDAARQQLRKLHLSNNLLREEYLRTCRRRLLQLEKSAARDLFAEGTISEEVLRELNQELDAKLTLLEQDVFEQNDEDNRVNSRILPSVKAVQDSDPLSDTEFDFRTASDEN